MGFDTHARRAEWQANPGDAIFHIEEIVKVYFRLNLTAIIKLQNNFYLCKRNFSISTVMCPLYYYHHWGLPTSNKIEKLFMQGAFLAYNESTSCALVTWWETKSFIQWAAPVHTQALLIFCAGSTELEGKSHLWPHHYSDLTLLNTSLAPPRPPVTSLNVTSESTS